MKSFLNKYESLIWALVCSLIIISYISVVKNLTEKEVKIVDEEATFTGYNYKDTNAGKIKNSREVCRFSVRGSSAEYENYQGSCSNLKVTQRVVLKIQREYSKYKWQKYYTVSKSSLLGVLELKLQNQD